jgi:hypothetical protein
MGLESSRFAYHTLLDRYGIRARRRLGASAKPQAAQ